MSDSVYYDYQYNFPTTGLATALTGFTALQEAGLLGADEIPENMLGDPMDINGNVVDPYTGDVAWYGRAGWDAYTYTDANGNTVTVPAAGDPSQYYVWIRAAVSPDQITVDPTTYGLTTTDPTISASVLGVWA